MTDRNEMIVTFQAVTGIDDIAVCFDILEQKGWDLMSAVNSVMPQDFSSVHASASSSNSASGGAFVDLTSDQQADHFFLQPTTVTNAVELRVYFKSELIQVQLPVNSTVAQVKERLKEETGLVPSEQILTGWQTDTSDETKLQDLRLNSPYHLRLEPRIHISPPPPFPITTTTTTEDTPPLEVVEPNSIREPEVVDSNSSQYSDAQDTLSSEEDDIDPEPLESLDDDALFAPDSLDDPTTKAMRQPLIPQECGEPHEALQHFTEKFEQRYGTMHPLFYIGSLADAMKEATSGSALSGMRKPMLVYIHHDSSVLSNVFCSQLLCSDSVVSYLTANYITWAWDLTFPEHRIKLLEMVEECFGPTAKSSVGNIQADHLPAILIIFKVKGAADIRQIIQGETNLDSLMATLIMSIEEHQVHIDMEVKEERERLAREEMIRQQNMAYQESLFADREKLKQKKEEELLKEQKAKEEEEQRQEKEVRRQLMEDSVPPEPTADCEEKLCTMRIRFPDGTTEQRRFLARHRLKDLMNFFGAKEYFPSDYKILTGFPRKDLTALDEGQTLEEAGLCPQETLFLEER